MDVARFDQFARSLAVPGARRGVLRLLAALPVAGLTASLLGGGAEGKRWRKQRQRRVDSEIVNWRTVAPGALPFMVYYFNQEKACGGSLIAPQIVLTAAHCMGPGNGGPPFFDPTTSEACIGQVNVAQCLPENVYRVTAAHPHPLWDPVAQVYDVGILQLDRPVPPESGMPVAFVGAGDTWFQSPGTTVRVAGWGAIFTNVPVSTDLLEVDVNVYSDQNCINAYGGTGIDPTVEICASGPSRDSCQGYSGGPLFAEEFVGNRTIKRKGKKRKGKKRKVKKKVPVYAHTQIGIVSFGQACADPAVPGVYARVSDPTINSFIRSFTG